MIVNEFAKDGGQDRFRAKVGLPLATYFSGPKVKWILDNVDGARAKAEAGDLAVRQHRHLVHLEPHRRHQRRRPRHRRHQRQPDDADGPRDPRLGRRDPRPHGHPAVDAAGDQGVVARSTARPGDLAGIPIAGDLGDQQAALFGQTCFDAGEAKNTYGTGCFMLLNTGTKAVPSKNGLLTTLGYKIGDQPAVYALEGSIAITGALVQWLRDNLGMITSSAEVEALAEHRRGQRRRVLRPGVLRPVRAVLAESTPAA